MEERADRSRRDEIGGWVSRLFRRRPPKAKRRRPKQRKDKKDLLGRGLPDDWPSPVDPAKTLVNSQKWCVRSNPTVSIVVVNHESAEYVFECIRQIWQNTTDV
ncbi:MAG TPA: hypothetical protein VFK86_12905, partial [Bauldia sp.]|nr:hypothetical protein [Bauldia sp.]